MNVEFLQASLAADIRKLVAFDRKVFLKADWFQPADWKRYHSFWMLVDGKRAGCCAFEPNVDFREDLEDQNPPRPGSLYISSTGVLPRYRGKGLGDLLKCWQIAYARQHGFNRIVTNMRQGNRAMIRLNTKFGFTILRTSREDYYLEPPERTVVMELRLRPRSSTRPSATY